jgi:hypothetical protein
MADDDQVIEALRHIYSEQAKQTELLERIRGSVAAISMVVVVLFVFGFIVAIATASAA